MAITDKQKEQICDILDAEGLDTVLVDDLSHIDSEEFQQALAQFRAAKQKIIDLAGWVGDDNYEDDGYYDDDGDWEDDDDDYEDDVDDEDEWED